jgi:hypothetical protein
MSRIEIPKWAEKLLLDQQCPTCHRPFKLDDVCASGNRRKNGEAYYFYEVECARCKNPAMSLVTTRPCDSAQLAVYLQPLVEQMLDGASAETFESSDPSPPKPLDRITDAEVKSLHELLRTCPSHIEFLLGIGMSEQDVKKYAQLRKK